MLRALGATIPYACCVIDRESGAASALAAAGSELRTLFTKSELEASAVLKRGESQDELA